MLHKILKQLSKLSGINYFRLNYYFFMSSLLPYIDYNFIEIKLIKSNKRNVSTSNLIQLNIIASRYFTILY